MWTVQELAMASQPIVVCGSKSMRWNSFFWGMIEARDPRRNNNSNSFLENFNSIITVTSFWYEGYRKEEFSEPVVRMWADSISQPILKSLATQSLDFLESHGRLLVYIQGSIVIAIILGQVLRGLRPLNTVWLIPPIYSLVLTMFFWPTPISDPARQSFQTQLIDVLNLTRNRQATQQEDKAFALYGVFKSLGISLSFGNETSFQRVYLEFTKQIIEHYQSLNILREAGIPDNRTPRPQDMPSWVPDWRSPLQPISLRKCNATGQSSPDFRFSDTGRRIVTKGYLADNLNFIASTEVDWQDLHDHEISTAYELAPHVIESVASFRSWIEYIYEFEREPGTASPKLGVFEVLHSDTKPEFYDSGELRDAFHRWYEILIGNNFNSNVASATNLQITINMINDEVAYSFHRRLLRSIDGRKLFVTGKGYFGKGPRDTRTNDTAVLISGFGMPMILRTAMSKSRNEQEYEVVGVAHIYKMMDEEAWPRNEAELRDFILV